MAHHEDFISYLDVIQVSCALIIKDKTVFVAQRNGVKSLPFKWEFPGGKIDAGETEEECLSRELNEELNIIINIKFKLGENEHNYGKFIVNLNAFIVEIVGGNLSLNEHNDCRWVNRNELKNLDLAEADVPLLNKLLETDYI